MAVRSPRVGLTTAILPAHSSEPHLLIFPNDPTPGMHDPDAKRVIAELKNLGPTVLRERLQGGLIVDLDDTLTTNNPLFLRSRGALVEEYLKLDPTRDIYEMGKLQSNTSNSLVPVYGFTPKRWYISALETGEQIAGRELTEDECSRIIVAADVAMGIGEFYPGVEEALTILHEAKVPVVLLTKGARDKQQEKIDGHDLKRYFDKIVICERKDAEMLKKVAKDANLSDPIMIGDSEMSDIKPAEEAGMQAILIDRGAPRWEVELYHQKLNSPKAHSVGQAILDLIAAPVPA